MGYDTKTMLRDKSGKTPIPQFFNPVADDFRPMTGIDLGNGRYGPDSLVWGKTSGGVYIPVQVDANGAVITSLTGSKEIKATLANAVEIRDTDYHEYAISDHLADTEIRQYKDWKLSVYSTLSNVAGNANGDLTIFTACAAVNVLSATTAGCMYYEHEVITNTESDLLYSGKVGGIGASARFKTIPALQGVHSNLRLRVQFANAPTSGTLTIVAEGVK